MPAEGVHQAQHSTLLAVARHLQQCLGLQFVDDVVELLLLCLHGLTQGRTAGDAVLQFVEVGAQALQQGQFFSQHLP
ncbi:hypothetical protein D3C79_1065960 [compost metagenome]